MTKKDMKELFSEDLEFFKILKHRMLINKNYIV